MILQACCMQWFEICPLIRLALPMRALDNRLIAVLMIGLLSSSVLLASSSQPPAMTVSELWGLREGVPLMVVGVLVHHRTYESGVEVMVLSDESGSSTVKVICVAGPGPAPGDRVDIGDLLEVSGAMDVEDGTPIVRCHYSDVKVALPSEDVVTVSLLGAAWHLFEGDRVTMKGFAERDASGDTRLRDFDGICSVAMRLVEGAPVSGPVLVDCIPVFDKDTMAMVLEVLSIEPIA